MTVGFDRSRGREVSGNRNYPQDAEQVTIEVGDTWEGVYLISQPPTGKMQSAMHYFRSEDGERTFKLWGSTVLDQTFKEDVKPGELVEITNEGKRESKSTGRDYNAWKVVAYPPDDMGDVPQGRPSGSRGNSAAREAPPPRTPAAERGPQQRRAAPPRDEIPPPDDDDIPF